MSFSDLGLLPELLRAVADKGYDTPSPIQIQAIPAVLAGRDVSRRCANRHRQNRRLRAAHSAAPHCGRATRHQPGTACAGADADPRTRRTGCAKRARLRQAHAAAHLPGVRRRQHQSADQRACAAAATSWSRLPAGCSILRSSARWIFPRFRYWCSMKPTACSTWVSSTTFAASSNCCRRSAKTCCSPPPTRTISAVWRNGCCTTRCRSRLRRAMRPIELVEQRAYRVQKEQKRHLLVHLIQEGQWRQVLIFTRTKHGANRLDAAIGGRRHPSRRHPRKQEPGGARQGARHVQARSGHLPGGH